MFQNRKKDNDESIAFEPGDVPLWSCDVMLKIQIIRKTMGSGNREESD